MLRPDIYQTRKAW